MFSSEVSDNAHKMAAPINQMRCLLSRRNCGLLHRWRRVPVVNFVRLSSDEDLKLLEGDTDDIEQMRNVSRMPERFWKLMKEKVSSPEEVLKYQPDWVTARGRKNILRKHYGKYGKASGVDPGMLWPTKNELKEIVATEKNLYPPLHEMVANVKKKIQEEEEKYQQREAEVTENYAKLQTWIKDLEARQQKKLAEAKAQKEKKEKLIEEVRAYFGYRVDPKDERFQELLEKKEKEERKAAKEARKKEKIAKEWEKITKMAEEAQAARTAEASTTELKPKSDNAPSSLPVTSTKSSTITEEK